MSDNISNAAGLPVSTDDGAVDPAGLEPVMNAPQLEGFQVHSLLGQGGMGSVWAAVQLSTGRSVALKLMRGGAFGSVRARARFDREVELLARLDHPNIARLYQSGTHQGLYFYAMERVNGVPLNQYVRERNLPVRQLLELMEKICRAVDHAHRRGVIHRDLKPGNLLVTAEGEPKVVDFGLAKLVAEEPRDLTAGVTMEGAMAGTLAYMSPEQAAGDLARIDTRTDVYSLGVILYEQVTGQLPHPPDEPLYELQRRIIHTAPPAPRHVNPGVDRELNTLILKAMQRDPEQRYANASELAEDLRSYRSGDPLHARPLTLAYVVRKRLAQHKRRVVALLVVVLLAFSAASYAYVRIAVERHRAEVHAEQTERTLYQHQLLLAKTGIEQGRIGHALELLEACPEPLRHWEWHYLKRQADNSEHTIHAGAPRFAAVTIDSHDGVARTLTRDGQLEGWDLLTGEPVPAVNHRITDVDVAAFNQVGDALLVYRMAEFDLLDARDGTLRQRFPWDGPPPTHIAGNPTGSQWAVVDRDDRLALIDASDGEVRWAVLLPDRCRGLIFNSRGELAVAAANQVTWLTSVADRPSHIAWRNANEAGDPIEALAFDPTGDVLATGDQRGVVCVWQRNANDPVTTFSASPHSRVTALTFDDSGQRLVSTAMDNVLAVWRWQTGRQLESLRGHVHDVRWLTFCSRRQTLVSGNAWNTLKFWNLDKAASNPSVTPLANGTAFSLLHLERQAERTYVVGVDGETTRLWQVTENGLDLLASDLPPAVAAAVNQAGNRIALADVVGVHIWPLRDLSQGQQPIQAIPASNVSGLLFGPDDQFLVGTSPAGLMAWDSRSGEDIASVNGTMLVASDDRDVWLMGSHQSDEVESAARDLNGLRVAPKAPISTSLHAFSVSPDGEKLAAASADGVVYLWDAKTQQAHRWSPYGGSTVRGSAVHRLCFTDDGRRLITAGPSIKLWDTETAEELLTMDTSLPGPYYHVSFDNTGQAIIAGTADHIVRWTIR